MNRRCSGGFPASQAPPSGGGPTPTPRPKRRAFSRHWRLISEESCSKNLKTIGNPSVSFPETNRHRITFFNFRPWIIGHSGNNQIFPSLLRRSSFPTVDWPQTPCHCPFSRFNTNLPYTTAPLGICFRVQCTAFVSTWFEECRCWFFIPTTPPLHWDSHRHGHGRSSGFRGDGCRANRYPEVQRLLGRTSLNPISHCPGHIWPCFFNGELLKKFLSSINLRILVFLVLWICFA